MNLNKDFEAALRELEEARIADDALHQHHASLQDRVASHEHLVLLRSEMAQLRHSLGIDASSFTGAHDSRTARGAGGD